MPLYSINDVFIASSISRFMITNPAYTNMWRIPATGRATILLWPIATSAIVFQRSALRSDKSIFRPILMLRRIKAIRRTKREIPRLNIKTKINCEIIVFSAFYCCFPISSRIIFSIRLRSPLDIFASCFLPKRLTLTYFQGFSCKSSKSSCISILDSTKPL